MVKTFVFMGLPGSGKGKQTELLSEKTGFLVVSTGAKLREIVKVGTAMSKKVAEVMNAGELLPSWFVSYIFQEALFSLQEDSGIIFEGVGRKEAEARLFTETCEWLGRDFRVLNIKVSETTVSERLHKRQEIEGRTDDNPAIFQNRLKNFYEHTTPALEFFRSIGKVIDIDGEPLPDLVFTELWQKVSTL